MRPYLPNNLLRLVQALRALLQGGSDVDARSSTESRTALHWAAIFGHKEVVDALIEHGASAAICDQDGHKARFRFGRHVWS